MPTYQQIPLAGNIAAKNVFRITPTQNLSDLVEVTAWDDYNMNTATKELLAGTTGNGNKSGVCVADTTTGPTTNGWATGLAQTPGGASVNRCRGNSSYVRLGTQPLNVGQSVTFQMAVEVAYDFTPGLTGHDIVIGIKVYYTGSVPSVTLEANTTNNDTSPSWLELKTQVKGSSLHPGYPTGIFATGPDSTISSLDPVTKPESGVVFAPEYWIQTAA